MDPDESPESALARELREELAIDVEVGAALEPVVWAYERGEIRLLPFFCTIIAGEPRAIEHEDLVWCAPPDFGKLDWADADLPVLDQIRALARETVN